MADGDLMSFTHLGASVLIPNPGAEQGTALLASKWSNNGDLYVTIERAVDHVHEGVYSQKILLHSGQTAPLSHYFAIRYLLPLPVGFTADRFFKDADFDFFSWLYCNDPSLLTFKTRICLCKADWSELSGGVDQAASPAPNTWTQISSSLSLGTPDPLLKGIEYRLYTNLVSDNPNSMPGIWWDDLSMIDTYVFSKNPAPPLPAPELPVDEQRLVDNSLMTYRHPATQGKLKTTLQFGMIREAQLLRLYNFYQHGKAVIWTPNLPGFASSVKIQLTGSKFSYGFSSSNIKSGFKLSLPIEEP